LGFQFFGLNPCVSHAYVRLVDFGKPVQIAGVEIRPGDLIHADKHGVCIIPLEIAERLAEGCREVERLERPLLELCRSDQFDLEEYIRRRGEMKAKIRE
jgi:regulator of RNase E activity RraA